MYFLGRDADEVYGPHLKSFFCCTWSTFCCNSATEDRATEVSLAQVLSGECDSPQIKCSLTQRI